MNVKEPVTEQVLGADDATPAPWVEAVERLGKAQSFWTATTHPAGRPHVRPMLAVWVNDALYISSDPAARKSRNLESDANCTVSASCDDLDIVLEGTAAKVTDRKRLDRVAGAYKSKYDWPVTIEGTSFTAPYAAPTAGDGPFDVYEITPVTVFGFPTSDKFAPTRWTF